MRRIAHFYTRNVGNRRCIRHCSGAERSASMGGPGLEATVKLLESLDQFLFGLVLIYFTYSIFFLFLAREYEQDGNFHIGMPDWLQVQSLGQMKKALLEMVVVLLAVLFWKSALRHRQSLPDRC